MEGQSCEMSANFNTTLSHCWHDNSNTRSVRKTHHPLLSRTRARCLAAASLYILCDVVFDALATDNKNLKRAEAAAITYANMIVPTRMPPRVLVPSLLHSLSIPRLGINTLTTPTH